MTTTIFSTNPAENYSVLGSVESHTETEIIAIVDQATVAQIDWSMLPISERVRILRDLYDTFVSEKETIAQSVSQEMGMSIRLARDEVQYGLNYYLWYLDNAASSLTPEVVFENETEIHTVYYEPK